jgi:RHS repeat-associated protein
MIVSPHYSVDNSSVDVGFGYGWSSNFFERATFGGPAGVTSIVDGSGSGVQFLNYEIWLGGVQPDGCSYTYSLDIIPPPGIHDTLTFDSNTLTYKACTVVSPAPNNLNYASYSSVGSSSGGRPQGYPVGGSGIPAGGGAVVSDYSSGPPYPGKMVYRHKNGDAFTFAASASPYFTATSSFTGVDHTGFASIQYAPSEFVDRNGSKIIYHRDANQHLTQLTDVHGRVVNFTWDSSGHVTAVTDNGGRTINYGYSTSGGLTRLTSITDVTGDVTHYAYDALGRMTQITYPNGGVKTYVYTADGTNRIASEYDDGGINRLDYAYSQSTGAVVTGTTTVTDVNGHATKYGWQDFSGLRQVTSIRDPAGNITALAYDSEAKLVSATDAQNRTTKVTYDTLANVSSVVDPAGGTSQASYERIFSLPTSFADPKGNHATLTRDGFGNLVQAGDALGNFTLAGYDQQGHVTSVKDALGDVTGITYNGNGAPINVTDPLGRTVSMGRDALSRLTSLTDPLSNQTAFTYAPDGKPTQIKDALNNITSFGYEAGRGARRPTAVTDANNHSTNFHYDAVGRLTSVANALNQSGSISYDSKSRPATVTTRNGQTITFGYDVLDRLTALTAPEGSISLGYDAVGNLTSAGHYNGSALSMSYDALNRVSGVGQTLPNGFTANISYSYDANSNRTGMTTPWGSFRYAYDSLNRVTSVTNPDGQTVTFTYDALSRRTSMTYPNGIKTTYAYDAAGQVKQIVAQKTSNQTAVAFDNYTYDADGNRVSMTDLVGNYSFGYDKLNRLTSANHPAASALPVQDETFGYDAIGNRTGDALRSGYTYDVANRLVSDSSFTYTYDANGNTTSRTSRASGQTETFKYNSANQMTETDEPSGLVVTYKYDPAGRRVEKSVGGTKYQYVYDGANVLAVLDGNNNPLMLFTQGPGIDAPMIGRINGTDYFYHADALGNVKALTDAIGSIVETVEYEAFGKSVVKDANGGLHESSTVGNPINFGGTEFDMETGLLNMGRRMLDASNGRFLQQDPISRINPYLYAEASPLTYIDPLGMDSFVAGINANIYVGPIGGEVNYGGAYNLGYGGDKPGASITSSYSTPADHNVGLSAGEGFYVGYLWGPVAGDSRNISGSLESPLTGVQLVFDAQSHELEGIVWTPGRNLTPFPVSGSIATTHTTEITFDQIGGFYRDIMKYGPGIAFGKTPCEYRK